MIKKTPTRPKGLSEIDYQLEKAKFLGYVPHDAVIKENRQQRRKRLRDTYKSFKKNLTKTQR